MSKRKDIEYIHQVTGLSYGESRRLYKEKGEDLLLALGLEEALKTIGQNMPDICQGLANAITTLTEALVNIDWSKALDAYINSLEEVNEDEN